MAEAAWVASLDWQPDEHAETHKSHRDAERHAMLLKLGRDRYADAVNSRMETKHIRRPTNGKRNGL